MNDIKLIVTDMDGTFLNQNYEVSPEFPEIYQELKKRNILFVPASGRQMSAITKYFKDIEEEIGFIAENGGYMVYKNKELFVDQLDHHHITDIIKMVRSIPKARAVLSAKNFAHYETDDQDFIDFFTQYYEKSKPTDDLTKVSNDNIFKIAVYHPEGSEQFLYPHLKIFEDYGLEVVISGEFWLDIMNKNINKGKALSQLQSSLNITPQQTMAFGDYMNDIEMLKQSHYGYAMENAHPTVKEAAQYEALSNKKFGVIEVIKNYLSKN